MEPNHDYVVLRVSEGDPSFRWKFRLKFKGRRWDCHHFVTCVKDRLLQLATQRFQLSYRALSKAVTLLTLAQEHLARNRLHTTPRRRWFLVRILPVPKPSHPDDSPLVRRQVGETLRGIEVLSVIDPH